MDEKIRVLIVEDEEIVGEAIHALLEREENITVVDNATNGTEAVAKTRRRRPDVILLDLHLPDKPGIAVIEELLQAHPEAHILVLTGYADDREVAAAFRAGASGYVLKTQAITDLVGAIENAHQGQACLHPTVARIMLRELHKPRGQGAAELPLSEAELRVLVLVAQGLSNKEIAHRLTVSLTTVRAHITKILSKLHLSNRTQAALYALKQGVALLEGAQQPGRVLVSVQA